MTRTEIKKKIKECLQKFDGVDSPDDMVSETLFNIYSQEMNEICRLFESEFRKLHQPTVIGELCRRCSSPMVNKNEDGSRMSCDTCKFSWST